MGAIVEEDKSGFEAGLTQRTTKTQRAQRLGSYF
jgi:hypothetical protein